MLNRRHLFAGLAALAMAGKVAARPVPQPYTTLGVQLYTVRDAFTAAIVAIGLWLAYRPYAESAWRPAWLRSRGGVAAESANVLPTGETAADSEATAVLEWLGRGAPDEPAFRLIP